eukprot:INCI10204.3.p1 GENE.INCI10204.3~~INCI10204.3.p1  ORF type:complete len:104 (+),score=10.00 INCI10204.3:156-467(+)
MAIHQSFDMGLAVEAIVSCTKKARLLMVPRVTSGIKKRISAAWQVPTTIRACVSTPASRSFRYMAMPSSSKGSHSLHEIIVGGRPARSESCAKMGQAQGSRVL